MSELKELLKKADWRQEKHVPAIDVIEIKDSIVKVNVSVGKEIQHPNTTEHHISWISLYFQPEGSKFPYELGKFDFSSHGASAEGPDTSTVYSEPNVDVKFKTSMPGVIYAMSYCNIHGLWENSAELKLS